MKKVMRIILVGGLVIVMKMTALAQQDTLWQLGPVSRQMCNNIYGIMTGEEEIVYILAQLLEGKIQGAAATNAVNNAQEHIRNEFVNTLGTIISQPEAAKSDMDYARNLLPNIQSTFSACDLRVSTFLTVKQIDKNGLQRVQKACSEVPANLYTSYCEAPTPEECAKKGEQAGKTLWRNAKLNSGAALCERLADVSTTELAKKLIEQPASECDDTFNQALTDYIDQQVEQMTEECLKSLPTPTPTPVVTPTLITNPKIDPGVDNPISTSIPTKSLSKPKVKLWVDKPCGTTYRVGEKILIFFQTYVDGYVTIRDIDTKGVESVIFPNKNKDDNFVRANVQYTIPDRNYSYDLIVEGPDGKECMKAYFSIESGGNAEEMATCCFDVVGTPPTPTPTAKPRVKPCKIEKQTSVRYSWDVNADECYVSNPSPESSKDISADCLAGVKNIGQSAILIKFCFPSLHCEKSLILPGQSQSWYSDYSGGCPIKWKLLEE